MIGFLRPYLATIKDSFREALATWVLKIMLILITLFLLAVAPLGMRRELTWRIAPEDISDVQQLAARLLLDSSQDKPSPGKHIWGLLGPDEHKKIESAASGSADLYDLLKLFSELSDELNKQLEREEFYDRASWQDVEMDKEARELRDADVDRLSTNKLARRNRLLLQAAFPDLIQSREQTSVQMRYLWFDILVPVPITAEQLEMGLNIAITFFMQWFAGPIGVFVGILVTAAIIPQSLESGSIELLLSKPVSRTLLFLSKFFGGCAFIFVNAVYLIGGLWLVLGFRFAIWNHRLLLCIPVFLFLFAIYYSVSALAGVIWRSAIVSIIVTIIFWVTCWSLGMAKGIVEVWLLQPNRVVRIVDTEHTLVTVNEGGQVKGWDRDARNWAEIFQPAAPQEGAAELAFLKPRVELGPLYDAENDRLIAVGATTAGGGGFGVRASLWIATPQRRFKRVEGAPVPPGTSELLFEPGGGLITVSPQGVYRLVTDAEKKPGGVSVLGMELPIPQGNPFVRVGTDPPVAVLPPSAVAMNPTNGELAILTRGKLLLLSRGADGIYRIRQEKDLKDEEKPSVMAYAGNTILVAREDGSLRVIRAEDLQVVKTLEPEGANAARFIEAAPNGTWFALVYHNGRLHLYDSKEQKIVRRRFAGQGDISTANFTDNRTLMVADRTTRITSYDVVDNKQLKRWAPASPAWEQGYRYVIVPLYTVYPKPGELGKTVLYLLSEQETMGAVGSDMRQAREQLKPWAPVWSSALFMMVMLAIACVYLWRTDL